MNIALQVRALEAFRISLQEQLGEVNEAIDDLKGPAPDESPAPRARRTSTFAAKATKKRERKPRAEGLAARVEATLDREGQPVSIIADALGAERASVASALQSLVKQGRAVKVGRGVFARKEANGAGEAVAEA